MKFNVGTGEGFFLWFNVPVNNFSVMLRRNGRAGKGRQLLKHRIHFMKCGDRGGLFFFIVV